MVEDTFNHHLLSQGNYHDVPGGNAGDGHVGNGNDGNGNDGIGGNNDSGSVDGGGHFQPPSPVTR